MSTEAWWTRAEQWAMKPEGAPPGSGWEATACETLRADLAFDLTSARTALQALKEDGQANPDIVGVLDLLGRFRKASAPDLAELAAEARTFAENADPGSAARALHVAGLALLRAGRGDDAATAVLDGLEIGPSAARRTWMFDTLAGVLIAEGAWIEALSALDYVAGLRSEVGDPIGIAITAGRRAGLAIDLGHPQQAEDIAAAALSQVGEQLPLGSRLRLNTVRVLAALDIGSPRPDLVADLARDIDGVQVNYLRGHAALALMRADGENRLLWLNEASTALQTPYGRDLVRAWADHLVSAAAPQLPGPAVEPTEGRFTHCLLTAERARIAGKIQIATAWLDRGMAFATATNRPLWMAKVDRQYRAIDPIRHAQVSARRYSGLPPEALAKTVQEDVTIVFNDLVGFTRRSTHIGPEATMETVRSLFELTAPLLASHQVRPLQYLGDGLLAVAQGEGHSSRGVAFAQGIVQRSGVATRIRYARGERLGLVTRAGVASGPVVLGLLGSFAKMEHLAIGRTTNLAARLQGVAEPGQVIAPAAEGAADERVSLKGLDEPIGIQRIVVHPAELAENTH